MILDAHDWSSEHLRRAGPIDASLEEAIQFHRALVEGGVESVLATSPEEGTRFASSLR